MSFLWLVLKEKEKTGWMMIGTGDSDALWPQRASRLLAPWLSTQQETAGPGDQSKFRRSDLAWGLCPQGRTFPAILNSEYRVSFSAANQHQDLVSVKSGCKLQEPSVCKGATAETEAEHRYCRMS